jgi:hypothetical protein
MSLAKFAAKLGSGARGAGNTAKAIIAKYPGAAGAAAGGAAGGLGVGIGKALGAFDDDMELDDIDDLESAGDYGSQTLRKLIKKLGLDL